MNDAYKVIPFADISYFADKKWWDWNKNLPEYRAFKGERATVFTTGNLVDDPEIAMLRIAERSGISDDPASICTGSNSGHQLINIFTLAGCKRIVLIGYDAQPGPKGEHHFFGEHPDRTQAPYSNQLYELKLALPFFKEHGIAVLNTSTHSAINFFPKVTLAEALS